MIFMSRYNLIFNVVFGTKMIHILDSNFVDVLVVVGAGKSLKNQYSYSAVQMLLIHDVTGMSNRCLQGVHK